MVAILSSVNINQIYRALAHDVDIINAHKNNSIFNRLDKAVEGQGANFDISNSLYELIIAARTATAATAAGSGPAAATAAATAAAQYKANVDDILKNQSGPSGLGAIKTYSDLTKHIPLSLIFYLTDTIHDFSKSKGANYKILAEWFVYMITKQLLINFGPPNSYSAYLDLNESVWNNFFSKTETIPKEIINSLEDNYFQKHYTQLENAITGAAAASTFLSAASTAHAVPSGPSAHPHSGPAPGPAPDPYAAIKAELDVSMKNWWRDSIDARDSNKSITHGFRLSAQVQQHHTSNITICRTDDPTVKDHWTAYINSSNINNLFDSRIIVYSGKDIAHKNDLLTNIQYRIADTNANPGYDGFLSDYGFGALLWIGGLREGAGGAGRVKKPLVNNDFINSSVNGFSKPLTCIQGCPSKYDNMNAKNAKINDFTFEMNGANALAQALRDQVKFHEDDTNNYEITRYQWRGTKNYFITKGYHAIFGMEKLTITTDNFNVEWFDFSSGKQDNDNQTYQTGRDTGLDKLKNIILSNLYRYDDLFNQKILEIMFGNEWKNFVKIYRNCGEGDKKFMMKMKILNMILDMKRSGDYIQSYAVKLNREKNSKKYILATGDIVCANISAYLHDNPTIYSLHCTNICMLQFYNIFKTDTNEPWKNTSFPNLILPSAVDSERWNNLRTSIASNCGANIQNMTKDEINEFRTIEDIKVKVKKVKDKKVKKVKGKKKVKGGRMYTEPTLSATRTSHLMSPIHKKTPLSTIYYTRNPSYKLPYEQLKSAHTQDTHTGTHPQVSAMYPTHTHNTHTRTRTHKQHTHNTQDTQTGTHPQVEITSAMYHTHTQEVIYDTSYFETIYHAVVNKLYEKITNNAMGGGGRGEKRKREENQMMRVEEEKAEIC